jgi:hypothetical protein
MSDDEYVTRLQAWRDMIVLVLGLVLVCAGLVYLATRQLIPTDVVSSLFTAIVMWLLRGGTRPSNGEVK